MVDGRVIVSLDEDWTPAGSPNEHFAAGIAGLARPCAARRPIPAHPKPTLIYAAGPARGARRVSARRKNVLLVSTLDNVRGRTLLFTPGAERRVDTHGDGPARQFDARSSATRAAPTIGRFIGVTNFLTPPSLYLADAATGAAREIMAPAGRSSTRRTSSSSSARRRRATGRRFPISSSTGGHEARRQQPDPDLRLWRVPELSETPTYSATNGKLWLEKGGVYVLANIRGGGEFGPEWHEAGLGVQAPDRL